MAVSQSVSNSRSVDRSLAKENNEEEFHDALEERASMEVLDLPVSIEESRIAMNLFLNNHLKKAVSYMEPWAKDSMYHALGFATSSFLQALMTCDFNDIEQAVAVTKNAADVCERFRRQSGGVSGTLSKITKADSTYTDEQMHAELCYAETLLERALLTFVQDENLISFVKGAFKIRSCYQSYKECQKMLATHCWSNPMLKPDFESGVRLGIGTFNLLLSALPSRVLKLLEFVGFQGDRKLGLQQLHLTVKMRGSLRQPLAILVCLAWNLIFNSVLGLGDVNLQECSSLLRMLLSNYPTSSLGLFFAGRYAEAKGDIQQATDMFNKSIQNQYEWRQFHHLCFWELMFCHAFNGRWQEAAKYANMLFVENRWSKSSYAYITACFLLANETTGASGREIREKITELMKQVSALKVRIAGKSLPLEKFCLAKSVEYLKTGKLFLAHYELLYFWNSFWILGKNNDLIKAAMTNIESNYTNHQTELNQDDYCLYLLLRALCLKNLQSPFQAEQCLLEIIKHSTELTINSYVVPNAYFELALMKFEEGDLENANHYMCKTKEMKGYLMVSRMHFRLHALNEKLHAVKE